MTEEIKTTNEYLETFKTVFQAAHTKLRILSTPKEELRQIAQIISEAAASNKMGEDEEFRDYVNKEVAIGIMQKLAKTLSYDAEVSLSPFTFEPLSDHMCVRFAAVY